MLIRNLTIHNFQSYYRTTSIDFGTGLNLIIGNGGKGKSKLFNAFYWVLFGDIYITDLGWCSTNELPNSAKGTMKRHEFINKKALYDCRIGDTVLCQVTLELEDDKQNTFTIERTVKAERKEEENWESVFAWNVSSNMLKVVYDDRKGTRTVNDDLAEDKIRELFPIGIRKYIWFQGESLDSLINFRKPEVLKDAVQHISYFPYYEKLTTIIALARTTIERREATHLREINKQNSEARSLLKSIEFLRNKIELELQNKSKIEDHIEKIQAALAEDEGKISGLAKFSELVTKYEKVQIEIKDVLNDLTNIDNEERKQLPSLWVLRGTGNLVLQCKDIINAHVEEEYTAPERKFLDNPSKAKLEDILYKDHQCYVCGSLVDDEHPNTRNWILNRLRMQEEYLREMEDYTNNIEFSKKFNMFLGRIQDYPDSLIVSIEAIDKQYKELSEKEEKLRVKLRACNERKKELDDQIEEIKRKNGIDPHREAAQYTTCDRSIRASRSNLEKEQKNLRICEDNIRNLEEQLKNKEGELTTSGTTNGVITSVEETEWKQISTILEKICKSVQESARKELLRNIEARANEFYVSFTKHDRGYKGRVEIGDDYSIQYDAGLNTSHEDRKKMSIINALLSLNQEKLKTYYPFISDAPTSNFDPDTTHKYLLGIKDVFHQSIIMTKDVVIGSDNYTDLFDQDKVTRIYELTSLIYKDGDSEPEIYEVSTNVERLK